MAKKYVYLFGTDKTEGDTTMRNYYLVFDLADKQIGWGPVNKATCGSVN